MLDKEPEGCEVDGMIPPPHYTQAVNLLLSENTAASSTSRQWRGSTLSTGYE